MTAGDIPPLPAVGTATELRRFLAPIATVSLPGSSAGAEVATGGGGSKPRSAADVVVCAASAAGRTGAPVVGALNTAELTPTGPEGGTVTLAAITCTATVVTVVGGSVTMGVGAGATVVGGGGGGGGLVVVVVGAVVVGGAAVVGGTVGGGVGRVVGPPVWPGS